MKVNLVDIKKKLGADNEYCWSFFAKQFGEIKKGEKEKIVSVLDILNKIGVHFAFMALSFQNFKDYVSVILEITEGVLPSITKSENRGKVQRSINYLTQFYLSKGITIKQLGTKNRHINTSSHIPACFIFNEFLYLSTNCFKEDVYFGVSEFQDYACKLVAQIESDKAGDDRLSVYKKTYDTYEAFCGLVLKKILE